MAVPLTKMREALAQSLDDIFSDAFFDTFHGWAVHYDCDVDSRAYKISKVEPWSKLHHGRIGVPFAAPGLLWIEEGRDEIDAYMEAKRRLEGASE
jgi:hypothetical protein